MIKSMTGFGKSSFQDQEYNLDIEVKTVNSRYLDVNIRMPNQLNFLEDKIKKLIKSKLSRGRVDVFIRSNNKNLAKSNILVDLEAAKEMAESLRMIAEVTKISEATSITVADILKNDDVLSFEAPEMDEERMVQIIESTLGQALDQVNSMREVEGAELFKDLSCNIDSLIENKASISAYSHNIKQEIREKLYKSIKEILDESIINEDRLANEIVLYADRIDINEELTRLDSHFIQFRDSMKESGPVGKKLDFITQELLRETNTIASKSSKIEILNDIISMKTIIEKIKEQVQNVE